MVDQNNIYGKIEKNNNELIFTCGTSVFVQNEV